MLSIPDSFIPVVNHLGSERFVSSDRRKYQKNQSSRVGDPAWYQVGRHGAGTGDYLLENGKLLEVVGAGGRGKWGFQNTKDHRTIPRMGLSYGQNTHAVTFMKKNIYEDPTVILFKNDVTPFCFSMRARARAQGQRASSRKVSLNR